MDIFKNTNATESKISPQRYDGWSLEERNPQFIKAWMPVLEWFYRYYFQVQTEGWHHIPATGKMLLVGSHNGGAASPDTYMFLYDWCRQFGYNRLVYALMHHSVWKIPAFAQPAAQLGAIIAHPNMAIAALQRGAAVLVYPGGAQDMFRPHHLRNKICLMGRKGFIKLALRENAPIVPLISYGAHDTIIVLADLYKELQQLYKLGLRWKLDADTGVFPIYLGLPWGVGIGPILNFPLPAKIYTRVCAPIVFERSGRAAARDRAYVNACYEKVHTQMQQELDNLVERCHNPKLKTSFF